LEELKSYPRIIFYDGDCGFCNTSVQFVLNRRKAPFYFLPLQSEKAKKLLDHHHITILLNTVYFYKDGKVFEKSEAAIQIARDLKGIYPIFFYIGKIIPLFIRDGLYNFIAKHRHRIKKGFCAVPSPEERKYFI